MGRRKPGIGSLFLKKPGGGRPRKVTFRVFLPRGGKRSKTQDRILVSLLSSTLVIAQYRKRGGADRKNSQNMGNDSTMGTDSYLGLEKAWRARAGPATEVNNAIACAYIKGGRARVLAKNAKRFPARASTGRSHRMLILKRQVQNPITKSTNS